MLAHFANDAAGVGLERAIAIHVSDAADGVANPLVKVKLRVARNLAREHDQVAFRQRFASDAAQRVLLEAGIKNVIADGVADFIGVTFRDRFRGKNITMRHRKVAELKG